ncbi:MAG: sialic acid TRAP transporter substrate-binding protein SiaP [candidate division NC10 bacterium]
MRRIGCWLGVMVLAVSLWAAAPASAGEPTYELKWNTVAVPTQHQYKGMEVFAKTEEGLSAGKIKARLFHSGQLGDQKTKLTKVQRGTLEMAFADPAWFSDHVPEMGVFGAAYVFRDLDHLYRVMLGPMGQDYFEAGAKKTNIRPLDVWYLGTRQLSLSTTKSIRKPEDMKDVKLRVPNAPVWIAMGKALGGNPTPLGFGELYLALKTGTVDAQDNPLPTNEAAKFYEVTKQIVMTSHIIGQLWPIINEELWKGMPPEYKQWIKMSLAVARNHMNYLVLEGEASLVERFEKQYGIKFSYPDLDPWRKNAKPAYKEFEAKWGAGLYEKIQTMP